MARNDWRQVGSCTQFHFLLSLPEDVAIFVLGRDSAIKGHTNGKWAGFVCGDGVGVRDVPGSGPRGREGSIAYARPAMIFAGAAVDDEFASRRRGPAGQAGKIDSFPRDRPRSS